MNRKKLHVLPLLLGACVLITAPAVCAADYSLADGKVHFTAPDTWPMLMEKQDGARQFVALQVKNPENPEALARITVTTQQVEGIQGFQQFLADSTARARKLPGYTIGGHAGATSAMHYTATENHITNAYTEHYLYRAGLGIQVRCVRPAAGNLEWRDTFDAGCRSMVAAVGK